MNTKKHTTATTRASEIICAANKCIREGSVLYLAGQTSDDLVFEDHIFTSVDDVLGQYYVKQQNPMPILMYSQDRQLTPLLVQGAPPLKNLPCVGEGTSPSAVLDKVFKYLEKSCQPVAFIIDFAESILPDPNSSCLSDEGYKIQQQIIHRAKEVAFRRQGHLIALVSRVEPINAAFSQMPGIAVHNIPLPDRAEREAAINILRKSKTTPLILAGDLSVEQLAHSSGGLNLDILSRMRYLTNREHPLTLDAVLDRKADEIRRLSGGMLIVHDEKRSLAEDIAGLAQLKLYVSNAKLEGKNKVRILLLGPPGTGKTLSAAAIAREMGTLLVSCVNVKDKYVGESDKRNERVIEICKSMSPIVIAFDECDKGFMGKSTHDSSSADPSIRGRWLEVLGDSGANNGISIVAMSNHVEAIETAFLDRLDPLAILEATSAADRARIAAIQLKREGMSFSEAEIARAFSESSKSYTGRNIIEMLGMAKRTAMRSSNGVIGYGAMEAAIDNMLHSFTTNMELMSLNAIFHTREREYLPWVAARAMGDSTVQLPGYIIPFLAEDGISYDEKKLEDRIKELSSLGY